MNCSEAREKIPEYLAGLLPDPQDLLEHIQTCPACQREMRLYGVMDELLARPAMPEELPSEIIQGLRLAYGKASYAWDALAWLSTTLSVSVAVGAMVLAVLPRLVGFLNLLAAATR